MTKKNFSSRNLTAALMAWALLIMPLAAIGQTRVELPRNKYSVQQDVQLGRQAAAEVERQMPILDDSQVTRYVQSVGQRLVNAIPQQYQQPAFRYTFRVVNARDINAFALPGGPMYVNRGMIEAARTEGEMAGVMAHEIAHVALRHGTAQATRQSSFGNQIAGIGAILGGAILGGQAGAAIGNTIYRGFLVNPYSREYETSADILGAQIMARAGYDPRDLANMFRTIERQSGGSGTPEWFSTHPNPGNRYATIEREAQLLRIAPREYSSMEFNRVQNRLRGYPRAQSMEEIARNPQNNGGGVQRQGRYESSVEFPSPRSRNYNAGLISVNVPQNWEVLSESNSEIWFAPNGAYGNSGITHGALVGFTRGSGRSLQQDTDSYVQGILQSNNYLQARSDYVRANVGGRNGVGIELAGRSPVTNRNEVVTVFTTYLRNGQLFYVVTVVPQNEAARYNAAFRNMLGSIRLND